jgi:hypothetical protein
VFKGRELARGKEEEEVQEYIHSLGVPVEGTVLRVQTIR